MHVHRARDHGQLLNLRRRIRTTPRAQLLPPHATSDGGVVDGPTFAGILEWGGILTISLNLARWATHIILKIGQR